MYFGGSSCLASLCWCILGWRWGCSWAPSAKSSQELLSITKLRRSELGHTKWIIHTKVNALPINPKVHMKTCWISSPYHLCLGDCSVQKRGHWWDPLAPIPSSLSFLRTPCSGAFWLVTPSFTAVQYKLLYKEQWLGNTLTWVLLFLCVNRNDCTQCLSEDKK